jgi:beta-phosphoglucomutase-like phosphatase (HAD superfamily)
VAVEDSAAGVVSARGAGCVVLAIGGGPDTGGAAHRVRSLAEVSLALLRRLAAGQAQAGAETTFHAKRY